MIPNRIETWVNLSKFAYLREFDGELPRNENQYNNGPVVVAQEIEGETGRIVRNFFVMLKSNHDGSSLTTDCPPHRIVSRDLRVNGQTPNYDPNAAPASAGGIAEEALRKLQRTRDEMLAHRERHLIYAQSYLDALKNAAGWKSNVEHLNSVVAQKDATIKERDDQLFELQNENQLNRQQIVTLQASYAALENQKSLRERVKVWCRSKLRKWRASLIAVTRKLGSVVRKDTHSS